MKHGSERLLAIDIETYSSRDLSKCGVYAYCEAEDFEILLFAYAFDDDEVRVIDLKCGEVMPKEVMEALTSNEVVKTSFNANFERICISKYFNLNLVIEHWRCTAVNALLLGLPGSLDGALNALEMKEGKLKEGKELIKFFSMPYNYGEDGQPLRHIPEDDFIKWQLFTVYCRRDVEVERALRRKLSKFRLTPKEEKLWHLDQRINDYGILVDEELIACARECAKESHDYIKDEITRVTGIVNPNSNEMLKQWLLDRDVYTESLSKEAIERLLNRDISEEIKSVLRLKLILSKTSIKKYEAMASAMGKDKRIRGLFQFYGASRTGRWAGRLVQVQNLPKTTLDDLDIARDLLKSRDYYELDMCYPSVPKVLSELIRSSFIPKEGSRFIIADYNAIEARVIAWLANEKWRLNVFNSHGRIYETSAAKMFHVPETEVTKGSVLREKGKIAELALGYQGGKGALLAMGALKMGLDDKEVTNLVITWRAANRNIVKLWKNIERAALKSVIHGKVVKMRNGIIFSMENGILFVTLPSGRSLAYINARVKRDFRLNKNVLTYEGVDQNKKQWGVLKTYGGKLTENIVQAIARDCLGEAMLNLERAGYKCVIHVHDEVVLEVPEGFGSVKEVDEIMSMPILWAMDLPLAAEVNESSYYRKY
ncbi:DNA polymerase [Clostridium subterminale]|uniref:DNA-directed DNA polymerase n=1 Tax=Clostridium subterminale TaxID=1550 RepID=A0ABN1KG05_CLOSU